MVPILCTGLGAHVEGNYGDCSSQCPGARKGPGKACNLTQLFYIYGIYMEDSFVMAYFDIFTKQVGGFVDYGPLS